MAAESVAESIDSSVGQDQSNWGYQVTYPLLILPLVLRSEGFNCAAFLSLSLVTFRLSYAVLHSVCIIITTRQTAGLPLFQAEVWFTIAEVFLGEEMIPDAQKCVDEIKMLFPLSHLVSYMQGLIKEKEGTHHELNHE